MSHASRQLEAGDRVCTDFDNPGSGQTIHVIAARKITPNTQSGVSFRVLPNPRKASPDAWIDADWFEPARGYEQLEDDMA